ncbi:hypothetical protein Hanom_Chr08g00735901 [Helianthus anomalus]
MHGKEAVNTYAFSAFSFGKTCNSPAPVGCTCNIHYHHILYKVIKTYFKPWNPLFFCILCSFFYPLLYH